MLALLGYTEMTVTTPVEHFDGSICIELRQNQFLGIEADYLCMNALFDISLGSDYCKSLNFRLQSQNCPQLFGVVKGYPKVSVKVKPDSTALLHSV